jgi:hypothetical protein
MFVNSKRPTLFVSQHTLANAKCLGRARALWLWLAASAALGCAPTAPHASVAHGQAATAHNHPAARPSEPKAAAADAALDTLPEAPLPPQPQGYAEFAAERAAYCRAEDVFNLQLAQADNPARAEQQKRFRASQLKRRTRKPFPDVSFANVRGWMYDHAGGPAPGLSSPGCAFGALSLTGELCSSVRLPGVVLNAEQASELLAKINAEVVPPPKYCMCGGKTSHMHSFVFYDELDTPVASVSLNLRFHDLYTSPQVGRVANQASVSEEFRAWYGGFCERVGMPLCFLWDNERADRFYAELQRTGAKCSRESPLNHIPDEPLAQLGPRERRALCAYNQQNVFRAPGRDDDNFGRESPEGERWIGRTLAWPECVATFPSCSVRLSEIMPCQERAMEGDPGFFAADARGCRALSSCLWGFKVEQTPAP